MDIYEFNIRDCALECDLHSFALKPAIIITVDIISYTWAS